MSTNIRSTPKTNSKTSGAATDSPSSTAVNKSSAQKRMYTPSRLTSSSSDLPSSTQKSAKSTSSNACYTPTHRNNTPSSAAATTSTSKQKIIPATPRRRLLADGTISHSMIALPPPPPTTPECFSKVSIETPRRPLLTRANTADELRKDSSEISNLSVAVRVRPMNAKECTQPAVSNVISVHGNEITVLTGQTADCSAGVRHSFQYDRAYWCCNQEHADYADQATVFDGTALPLLDNAFDGYNACLFAYGQTGSGKSYSMMGIDNGGKWWRANIFSTFFFFLFIF